MKKILFFLILAIFTAIPAMAEGELGFDLGYMKLKDKRDSFKELNAGIKMGYYVIPSVVLGLELQHLGYDKIEYVSPKYKAYHLVGGAYVKAEILKISPVSAYFKVGYGGYEQIYNERVNDRRRSKLGKQYNWGIGADFYPWQDKDTFLGLEYRSFNLKPKNADKYEKFGGAISVHIGTRFGKKAEERRYSSGGLLGFMLGDMSFSSYGKPTKKSNSKIAISDIPGDITNRVYGKNGSWFGK